MAPKLGLSPFYLGFLHRAKGNFEPYPKQNPTKMSHNTLVPHSFSTSVPILKKPSRVAMFIAQIRHKLTRQEEQMEDLLTSNVFGLWRYIPPELGLTQFLGTARRIDGQSLIVPTQIGKAQLDFWPRLQEFGSNGAEPDVLINLVSPEGRKLLILVEAKFLSGKSSEPNDDELPNDQLAREMQILRSIAGRKAVDDYAIVYVTAQSALPRRDFQESISELGKKTGEGSADHFYWTTWRELPQILIEARVRASGSGERALLEDLGIILVRLGLTRFSGIDSHGWNLGSPHWKFLRPYSSISWSPISMPPYRFRPKPTQFEWSRRDSQFLAHWRWPSGE